MREITSYWFDVLREITSYYHIFCCNMLFFACPIIAKSVLVIALRANTGVISVFALIYPYLPPYSTSVSAQWFQSTRKDDA